MNRILMGILLGLAAGSLDVLLMLPMKHPDKAMAMTGAFFSRFAIGFLQPIYRCLFIQIWRAVSQDSLSAFRTP